MKQSSRLRLHDTALIGAMGLVAACGLVYEYLMAHFAGRILGAVEPTLYTMIGLMIVAMGLGAFAAKWISSIYRGFAWLELGIAVLGGTSVLALSAAVAVAYALPEWLRAVYGLDSSIVLDGGVAATLVAGARLLPFVAGFAIGFLIGMEIPLIARVREHIHARHLEHNLGTMYGADYIGAGAGAAVWVLVCLKMPIVFAAVGAAALNTLVGAAFLTIYRAQLKPVVALWIGHGPARRRARRSRSVRDAVDGTAGGHALQGPGRLQLADAVSERGRHQAAHRGRQAGRVEPLHQRAGCSSPPTTSASTTPI